MSATTTLLQTAASVPVGQVFSTTVYLSLLGGTALFFRPLLVGIGRALFLTVRPRRTKAELAARQASRDALERQRAALSLSEVEAAEVRALACRH
ncbi:hypothetical protein B0920_23790 [Massilia sp. KIM]|uniref:hypothetical protein n=1 Tax=Massilia sp. KIM TaxID=1955422 RepID=UPI00098FCB66|nr:hypothetical protein [Massilia sp. KIM]OON59405.1 hypothetical protein B0920_23790 [Massilia sp. KIM]